MSNKYKVEKIRISVNHVINNKNDNIKEYIPIYIREIAITLDQNFDNNSLSVKDIVDKLNNYNIENFYYSENTNSQNNFYFNFNVFAEYIGEYNNSDYNKNTYICKYKSFYDILGDIKNNIAEISREYTLKIMEHKDGNFYIISVKIIDDNYEHLYYKYIPIYNSEEEVVKIINNIKNSSYLKEYLGSKLSLSISDDPIYITENIYNKFKGYGFNSHIGETSTDIIKDIIKELES